MSLPLSKVPSEILREVRQHKWLAFAIFVLVCAGVLAVGFLWHYKYQSEVVIFVDDSNIIKPLMEGSAVTTKISDRASAAEQMLSSHDLLAKVAQDNSIFGPGADNLQGRALEKRINKIRNGVSVKPLGKSYFGIDYTSDNPDNAFLIAQKLGQLFISDSDTRKKQESRDAYSFIDKQVKAYEQQLQDAQEKLKNFETKNTDGTENQVNTKIADLRGKIELAKLDIEQDQSEKQSLEQQLKGINQTVTQGQTEDAYQNRINSLEQKLDNLRLQYKDTYPDIVNLRRQIKQLQKQHAEAKSNKSADQVTEGQQVINPLYQNLRAQLATISGKIESNKTRLKALNAMLAQEQQRMKRIQAHKSEYAELTRGMQVNKDIYDDLLKRREKARVSMRMDLDGQGLNFRIQQSAQYPLVPVGPKFELFAAAGLLLGLVAPFGLAGAFVQVDPRVREKGVVEEELGIPVLTVLPEVRTPFEHRRSRRLTWLVVSISVLCVGAYIAVSVLHITGAV